MKPKNDEFCILPWVHASISNTGKVSPCCRLIHYNPEPFGNLHQSTIDEIRNNQRFDEFRQIMLDGQTPLNCKECHLQEVANVSTLRTLFNKKYADIARKVKTDKINAALPMKYGEIRFSNICNLACRTCGIESSSRWHKDHLAMNGVSEKIFYSHPEKEAGLVQDFIQHIDSIDTIYFAGGEPLLHQAHYDLLQILIEKGRTDITLVYNSNMTTLKLGNNYVLKLWEKFRTVTIYASIDAVQERFNLIRHGEDWKTVEENIKKIKIILPKVEIVFSPTISVLNLAHLPDLIEYSLTKRLVPNLSFIQYNFLFDPPHYQINLLPLNQRSQLISRLNKIIENQSSMLTKDLTAARHFIENAFKKQPSSIQIEKFKTITKKLDFLRQESTKVVLPELAELLD